MKVFNFECSEIGFYGDTFVARQRDTNDILHFLSKFEYN